LGVLIRHLNVKNSEGLSLRQNRNAQIGGLDTGGVATAGGAVARKDQMRMRGAQCPAGLRFEGCNRELAVVPLTCNFNRIVRRIEQSNGTTTRRKDLRRKTERGGEYFFASLTAL
jgi:hypothetical protein